MYSKWHKIDLHIHTDKSKETKTNDYQGNFSVNVLLEKLKANSIDMISLTDHNIINCDGYQQMLSKDIGVLVGVELDVILSKDYLKEYINKIKVNSGEKINNKPFHALIIFKSANYKSISDKLEKMYKTISKEVLGDTIDLLKELTLRVTTFDYIVRFFRDEDFFIIAHGDKDKGIVGPYKKVDKIEEAQNEILVGGISALEMKSNVKYQHTISRFNEGFQRLIKDDFKCENPTSYVVFSDNHDCNNYEIKDFQTWIKGNSTFETLRLAFSDPESRIHTALKPPKIITNYIDSINIKLKDGIEQPVMLSPYLNVIIGGRSSGKSLLFNTIVNLNNQFHHEDKRVFNQHYKKMIDLEKTKAKLSVGNYEDEVSIAGEAYYQEKIIKLFDADEDLRKSLQSFFPDFDDEDVSCKEKEIDEIISQFTNAYEEYYDTSNKMDKGDIRGIIDLTLKSSEKVFTVDIKQLKPNYTLEEHVSVDKKLNKFKKNLSEMQNLELKGEKIFNDNDIVIIDNLKKLIDTKLTSIYKSKKQCQLLIEFLEEVKKINENYIREELTQEKQVIEDATLKFIEDLDDYSKYFMSCINLKEKCRQIETIDIKINDKINAQKKYSFVSKINFDINGNKIIEDFFKEKIFKYNADESLYQNVKYLANNNYEDIRLKQHKEDGKYPHVIKEKLLDFIKKCKSKKTNEIIENTDSGHEISTSSTSQGKKASIFLDVKLNSYMENTEAKVLFIDQLEDNIDNKYISQELVNLIRALKKNMQIVLVTHNPTIAIYGDAENIIIAENDGQTITFKQGGLEIEAIRDEACKILDGGQIAFKNRMDKYNIDKLLTEGAKSQSGNQH